MIIDLDSNKIEALENLWVTTPIKKRRELLKALGYHTSWAKIRTIKEIANRGGGMVARGLLDLIKHYSQKKPGTRITFGGVLG